MMHSEGSISDTAAWTEPVHPQTGDPSTTQLPTYAHCLDVLLVQEQFVGSNGLL